MGLQCFTYSDAVPGLEPIPAWLPGRPFLAYLTGLVLIATAALIAAGKRPRLAAISGGCFLSLWVLVLHLPKLASDPSSGREWTTLFETLELSAAAWILAGMLGNEASPENGRSSSDNRMIDVGRVCFAIAFPVFAVLHYIYRDYTASVVPSWIPGHMFWAYFTGLAHLAAGAAILFKVRARLAATLLGIMVGSWAVILHLPRVVANPTRSEWTQLFIALATSGSAFIVAGALAEVPERHDHQEGQGINEETLAALLAKPPGLGAYDGPGGFGEKSRSRKQSG